MIGLTAFLRGLGFRAVRPALYIWFANFFFALFMYWGYYHLFSGAAGESKIAADITGETGIFTFLVDIAHNYGDGFSLLISLALLGILLFLPVSIFTAGGIYSVLFRDERTTFSNLIASSVENFFDMFKIFLINIVNWVAAAIIPVILLLAFTNSETLMHNETAIRLFTYGWIAITLLLYTFSTAIYDFSRILRLKEDRNVFYIFKEAFLFTFANKFNVLMIFLTYTVSLAVLFLVYIVFNHFLENVLFVFFLFIIYQGFLMTRYFLKIAVMRAEIKLMETTG